ncbi:zinc finger protein 77-like [Frankliniella occidentalis]|uniref:Zinc finger protein 77-like n=1 Tax=Frankliniella occidentalis TaxID=133901 RepID=A0A6J1T1E4_FRAOC|nr:zinc finger protein 77-like [Frankliniella occidentalis]
MNKHLKTHTGEKPHQCTVCKNRFRSGCALKVHLFRKHTNSGPYECSLCHKFFQCPSYLIIHITRHVNTPPFGCPLCHKPQGDRRVLYHHLKEHVPVKVVRLPYQTTRGPTPPAPFLCTECGGRFRKCERLLQHLWTHIRAGRGRGGP